MRRHRVARLRRPAADPHTCDERRRDDRRRRRARPPPAPRHAGLVPRRRPRRARPLGDRDPPPGRAPSAGRRRTRARTPPCRPRGDDTERCRGRSRERARGQRRRHRWTGRHRRTCTAALAGARRPGRAAKGSGRMNAYDALVEWASEVGSGSWRSWRESCAYLGLEENSAARKLAAVGHVEFDWVGDRVAAAPPAAVLPLRSSGCLRLTGARGGGARERLEALYEDEDRRYNIALRPPVAQDRGPSTWLVEAELDELDRFCTDAGYAL